MLLINLPFSLVPPFTKKSGIFHFWTIDTAFVTLFFYCEHSFSYLLFDLFAGRTLLLLLRTTILIEGH